MFVHYLVRILMCAVFLSAMADVWSTNRAIAKGAKEANPVMAFFMRVLKEKWLLARLVFSQAHIFTVVHSPAAAETWKGVASFGLNLALMAYVIWNNIKVAAKQGA